MQPTHEQLDCVEKAKSGKKLRVGAYAGTGKTSTLTLLSDALQSSGTYLCFNAAIAAEARKKFPRNVTCSTQHSMANKAIAPRFKDSDAQKMTGRVNGGFLAYKLHLRNRDVSGYGLIKARGWGFLMVETVKRFQRSGDPAILDSHVPLDGKLASLEPKYRYPLMKEVAEDARRLWEQMIDPRSDIPLGFDGYLKLWAMGRPQIEGDFLMLDEAQDCQPAGTIVTTVTGRSEARGRPVVLMDKRIEDIKVGDKVVSYRNSGVRLTGSTVTSISSRAHDGDLIVVTTSTGVTTRYTPEHICLAKLGRIIDGKSIMYLMQKGISFRVGVTSFVYGEQGSTGFAGRMHDEKADAVWLLDSFDDRQDALLAEGAVCARYGIPDLRFLDRGQRSVGQVRLDQFWASFGDMTEKATVCLAAFGRDVRFPLARRSFSEEGNREDYLLYSRAATIRACNLISGMEVIDVRRELSTAGSGSDHRPGIKTPITVRREPYQGAVWSMAVDPDHTYVADGIATHNCNGVIVELMKAQQTQLITVGDKHQQLYEFRGALNAMSLLPTDLEARLSTSFRFGQAIADNATRILKLLGETLPLKGNPDLKSTVGDIANPNTVLCRTNGRLIECLFDEIAAGKKPVVVGGVAEIMAFVDAAEKLQAGQSVDYPLEFFGFKDWAEVKMITEMDEGAADLRRWVQLIERYGVTGLRRTLSSLPKEERDGDITYCTGHKSKGREWERVALEDDFLRGVPPQPPKEGEVVDASNVDAELRLFYVAATRGQIALSMHPDSIDRLKRLEQQRTKARAA